MWVRFPPHPPKVWACGAVGSAIPWHGIGREFEPPQVLGLRRLSPHQVWPMPKLSRRLVVTQSKAGGGPVGHPIWTSDPERSGGLTFWSSKFDR